MFKFGKKKKKEFRASCELSKEPLEKGSGYIITTAQLIASKKFWDNKMTEPETLSYTEAHFRNQDSTSTHMRQMIFNKFGNQDKPWIISESYGHLFDIDLDEAKNHAREWWEREGDFIPDGTDKSLANLESSSFEAYKDYAVMEAGRARVAV